MNLYLTMINVHLIEPHYSQAFLRAQNSLHKEILHQFTSCGPSCDYGGQPPSCRPCHTRGSSSPPHSTSLGASPPSPPRPSGQCWAGTYMWRLANTMVTYLIFSPTSTFLLCSPTSTLLVFSPPSTCLSAFLFLPTHAATSSSTTTSSHSSSMISL